MGRIVGTKKLPELKECAEGRCRIVEGKKSEEENETERLAPKAKAGRAG